MISAPVLTPRDYSHVIAFDAETFPITRLDPFPRLVCLSATINGHEPFILAMGDGPDGVKTWLISILSDDSILLVNHYIAYDMCCICRTFPDLSGLVFAKYWKGLIVDTQIRQQLVDIAIGRGVFGEDQVGKYTLASLYKHLFARPIGNVAAKNRDDSVRVRYGEVAALPLVQWPPEFVEYALEDARAAFECWVEQEKNFDHFNDDAFQAFGDFCLSLISGRGQRTNAGKVFELHQNAFDTMEQLKDELAAAGLLEWDKKQQKFTKKEKRAKEIIEAACIARGVKPMQTKRKQTATSREAAVWCGDPLMLKRADFVSAEKLISTYYPPLLSGVEAPITTRFNLAATGRTTSSAPKEPLCGTNLQNAPRKGGVRECYEPRPGYIYLIGDLGGAELHTHAQWCKLNLGYSTLGDALNLGTDVHALVGAKLIEMPFGEFMQRLQAKDSVCKKARQDAKPANFGFPGGMMGNAFIKDQIRKTGKILEMAFVMRLREVWLQTFPEMEEFIEGPRRIIRQSGNMYEASYPTGRIRKCRRPNQACNSRFQSPAADGGKLALIALLTDCFVRPESPLYGCGVVNWIHDEAVLEIPRDPSMYDLRARYFAQLMANAFNQVVPDYPTEVEPVISMQWTKDAETTYDEQGRITEWKPC